MSEKISMIYQVGGKYIAILKDDYRLDGSQIIEGNTYSEVETAATRADRWVTINGAHVLIGKDNRIVGGMGGKFNGFPFGARFGDKGKKFVKNKNVVRLVKGGNSKVARTVKRGSKPYNYKGTEKQVKYAKDMASRVVDAAKSAKKYIETAEPKEYSKIGSKEKISKLLNDVIKNVPKMKNAVDVIDTFKQKMLLNGRDKDNIRSISSMVKNSKAVKEITDAFQKGKAKVGVITGEGRKNEVAGYVKVKASILKAERDKKTFRKNVPELGGSEKQKEWAKNIIDNTFREIDTYADDWFPANAKVKKKYTDPNKKQKAIRNAREYNKEDNFNRLCLVEAQKELVKELKGKQAREVIDKRDDLANMVKRLASENNFKLKVADRYKIRGEDIDELRSNVAEEKASGQPMITKVFDKWNT